MQTRNPLQPRREFVLFSTWRARLQPHIASDKVLGTATLRQATRYSYESTFLPLCNDASPARRSALRTPPRSALISSPQANGPHSVLGAREAGAPHPRDGVCTQEASRRSRRPAQPLGLVVLSDLLARRPARRTTVCPCGANSLEQPRDRDGHGTHLLVPGDVPILGLPFF